MYKIKSFVERLKGIGITVELLGNYPWIYLDKVNGKKVTERFHGNHGFTIAFLPAKPDQKLEFTDIAEIFKIIRQYTKINQMTVNPMEIRKFTIDGDMMAAHNLVAELNPELQKYGLSIEIEDEVHDGYDVAILSAVTSAEPMVQSISIGIPPIHHGLIKLELLDPTGVVVEHQSLAYHKTEGMRVSRYLLTIGNKQFYLHPDTGTLELLNPDK
jgi:hypothetical protein